MRTGLYQAPFDTAEMVLGTLTLATSGKPNVVIDLTDITSGGSSLFFHYNGVGGSSWCTAQDNTGADRLTHYAPYSFDVALTTALVAEATAQGWANPSNLSASFRRDNTPIGYRLRYTGSSITATWSASIGRALFGFSANVAVAAETLLADVVPTHCIVPTLEFSSDDSPNFEPETIANHVMPDDNSLGTGVSRYVAPIMREWVQQYETGEKTERLRAAAAHPWTFQQLFEYCRGERPICVAYYRSTAHGGEVFVLATKGTRWRPERASRGNDAQFHIPFECHVLGTLKDA